MTEPARPGRPREPATTYQAPTAEERRLGAVFMCAGCEQEWPVRLRYPYQARRCRNCGLEHIREARRAERRADIVETKSHGAFDFNDPKMMAAFVEDKMPPEEKRAVEKGIEDLITRASMIERMGGEVEAEPRKRLPKGSGRK